MHHLKLRITILFLAVIVFSSCNSQKGNNNCLVPGELWNDTEGVHINAHGGGIIFNEGIYYWFGEHKTAGRDGNTALVGVGCYSSKDLIKWHNEGIALEVSNNPQSEITKGCVIERPKVIYNQKTDQYVMWFHLELKGKGYHAAKTGVAVSKNITGPYTFISSYRPNAGKWPINYNGRRIGIDEMNQYEWWTEPFDSAVVDGLILRRDFEKGQMSRDMTLFVDDDGRAYHIHSSEENLTLHISELSDDYLSFKDDWVRVFPMGHNEAPAIFKRKNKYYMITSGCTGWDPNEARLAVADSMMGEWHYIGNPCVGEHSDKTFFSQSTYVIQLTNENDAYIFMADRWEPSNPIDGRYVWLPIRFENNLPIIEWRDEWDLTFFER